MISDEGRGRGGLRRKTHEWRMGKGPAWTNGKKGERRKEGKEEAGVRAQVRMHVSRPNCDWFHGSRQVAFF